MESYKEAQSVEFIKVENDLIKINIKQLIY